MKKDYLEEILNEAEECEKEEISEEKPVRKRKKSPLRWILPVAVALIVLAAAAVVFFSRFAVIDGYVLRKNELSYDLREKTVSVETYNKIKAAFPAADILWGVPVGGSYYSSDSAFVTLTELPETDDANLLLLKNLASLDATAAVKTTERYDALHALLPNVFIRWSVPIGGSEYPSDSETVALSGLSVADIANFDYFTGLRSVDATRCTDLDAVLGLSEALPEADVTWTVPLGSGTYAQDTAEIRLNANEANAQELLDNLQYLPSLTVLTVEGDALNEDEQDEILTKYPNVNFIWQIHLQGKVYPSDTTELSFAGKALSDADVSELAAKLGRFSSLETLDLTGCNITVEQFKKIADTCPGTDVLWAFEICGVPVSTDAIFLDFSNIPMESTDEVETFIPYLHRLEKIDMSYTGFDDETMDAMNKRYENVRVVWTMDLCEHYHVRTDDKGFIGTFNYYGVLTPKSIQRFQYCEDMVCMDLGHRVTFDDLSVLYKMPQLEYLLLADCWTTDFTPVGSLENLIYLEMIIAQVTDLTPILNCKNLKDLNICFCYYMDKETTFNVLKQMTWLERLYYSVGEIPEGKEEELAAALPNTEVQEVFELSKATGYNWRYHERYYIMRDYLNAWYMGPYGGRQYTKMIDGVEVEVDPDFLAQQRTADDIVTRHGT